MLCRCLKIKIKFLYTVLFYSDLSLQMANYSGETTLLFYEFFYHILKFKMQVIQIKYITFYFEEFKYLYKNHFRTISREVRWVADVNWICKNESVIWNMHLSIKHFCDCVDNIFYSISVVELNIYVCRPYSYCI